MSVNDGDRIKVRKILDEALSEALSENSSRSYREIWVDMLGKIMNINDPQIAEKWKKEDQDLQDEIGAKAGYSFEVFVNNIEKIELSILKTLVANNEQPALN